MALKTLGTNATNSLSAVIWQPGMSQSDFALFQALIKGPVTGTQVPYKLDQEGFLYLPGRDGFIQLLPGDYLATDSTTGWPIVLNANAVANGPYTHS